MRVIKDDCVCVCRRVCACVCVWAFPKSAVNAFACVCGLRVGIYACMYLTVCVCVSLVNQFNPLTGIL